MSKREGPWVLVYRVGGTERFEWRRTLAYATRAEAEAAAADNRRMGYRTYVERLAASLAVGVPDTYGPEGV